jgi:hypothetical protein
MATLLAGCEPASLEPEPEREAQRGDGVGDDVTLVQQPVYYQSTKLWNDHNINVCWLTSGFDVEKAWVRDTLKGQRSWETTTNVTFTGWGTCASDSWGIKIKMDESGWFSVGIGQANRTVTLNFDFSSNTHTNTFRCTANALNREQCIRTVAIHEFGHALGLAHESNRGDSTCGIFQGADGDTPYGPFDPDSLMAIHCPVWAMDLSGLDRRGTEKMYGHKYLNDWRSRDFNNDQRADLVCADGGTLWVDYADFDGHFNGTDFMKQPAWCPPTTGRLYKGDFNGDNRTDLLCHTLQGAKFTDLADGNGHFNGTDFVSFALFCGHDTAQLYIGDFNNDNRDDLLCHDVVSGVKWIDYAASNGRLNGTDWSTGANWCGHASGRLFVGDFDGNGSDDILCHDRDTGRKWIDYASSGQFNGTDWEVNLGFCSSSAHHLYIGYFDNNTSADLLCQDEVDGSRWIDYASNGQFLGSDLFVGGNWCSHRNGRLQIGDYDGDKRDDWLCHDIRGGMKWVDYAKNGFGGTDWSTGANWCGHDAGRLY